MQGNLTLSSFALICVAIACGSVGQILLKLGLGNMNLGGPSTLATLGKILQAMTTPYVFAGLACYVLSTLFWMLVLTKVRLSVAYPLLSMGYFAVVMMSSLVLHEHVNWRFAGLGLLCISIGVSFIGFGMGQVGGK